MNLDSPPPPSSKRLQGKVVIITGGASGIGAASSRLFHQHGATVIVADIQDSAGRSLAAELGPGAGYVRCNVSKEEDVINLVDSTVANHGSLDVVFSNAGILDRAVGTIVDTTASGLEKMIGVNLVGAFLVAKHAARVMAETKTAGSIIFTTSAATVIGGLGNTGYAATKHSVLGLAKSLAGELGPLGIRVNCVSPYAVATSIAGRLKAGQTTRMEMVETLMGWLGNLSGQVLKPETVGMAALYLASDEARHVSGVNLVVDGGFSTVNPTLFNHHRWWLGYVERLELAWTSISSNLASLLSFKPLKRD